MINNDREKLLNVIVFFLKNTKYCGKTKLFKLLNFADFLHFRQTGKSITGLEYYAWDKGPVPKSLFEEFKNPPKDLLECFIFSTKEYIEEENEKKFFKIQCRKKFDEKYFSERELEILNQIAYIYKEIQTEDIIEVSHLKNRPWYETYHKKGRLKKIDYLLAIDDSGDSLPIEIIQERMAEIKEMKKIFG